MSNGLNGYGKTGLAAAVTKELMQRNKFPVFSQLQDLISDIQSTYHPESKTTRDAKMQHYQAAPYLILDECNLPITDDRLSIFEELVCYRYAHSLPTLFTTNWGKPNSKSSGDYRLARWSLPLIGSPPAGRSCGIPPAAKS